MSPPVVKLAPAPEPVVEAVEMLEDLLALAKSGELREIAFVAYSGHETTTGFTSTKDQFRRIGQLHRLIHRMQLACDE